MSATMDSEPDNPPHQQRPPRNEKPSREERLAAKLRENLRRRKAQARAQEAGAGDEVRADLGDSAGLSKGEAKS